MFGIVVVIDLYLVGKMWGFVLEVVFFRRDDLEFVGDIGIYFLEIFFLNICLMDL